MRITTILSLIIFSCISTVNAQTYWRKIDSKNNSRFLLDTKNFQNTLKKGKTYIPTAKGLKAFKIVETSNFEEKLAKKHPEINSYQGYQLDNPNSKVFISSSPNGISTTIIENNKIVNINKDKNGFYSENKIDKEDKLTCLSEFKNKTTYPLSKTNQIDDQKLREYRIAISTNGEYTQFFGGTKEAALAAINESLTNINAVYQSELSIRFILVNDNEKIIFTDPKTDPYSPSYIGGRGQWIDEVQRVISDSIGEENYEIGHLFAGEGNLGLSGCLGCIGEDGVKGGAFTAASSDGPRGTQYDIDYVAHEIGHQLGANHTFSSYEGVNANFEPGSGTTIMGYAGLEGFPIDAQKRSDPYFNFISISQISENIKSKSIGKETPLKTKAPEANAGKDYHIPAGTPFKLTAKASGNNSDKFLYSWEQADSSTLEEFHVAQPDKTTGQLFRSFPPSKNKTRYFPSLPLILEHRYNDNFESLPQVSRELNFNLIVRDGEIYGQNKSDAMKIYVQKEATPFSFKPTQFSTDLIPGDIVPLEWNVSNTNLAPYNVNQVNILWSLDGGKTFDYIAKNQPNNGMYDFELPDGVISKKLYFMIEAVDNIFFATSQEYSLGYKGKEICKNYEFTNLPLSIPDGVGYNMNGDFANTSTSVDESFDIKKIKLNLDIVHSFIGDLSIILSNPNNENVVIYSKQCASQIPFKLSFSDFGKDLDCDNLDKTTFVKPAQRIDNLNKFSPKGNWNLFVSDGNIQNTGIIKSASLELCRDEYEKVNLDKIAKRAVQLYPNPAENSIYLKGLKGSSFTYFIYSKSGKLITKNNSLKRNIDISFLEKGVYFIVVQQSTNTHYLQLMKK